MWRTHLSLFINDKYTHDMSFLEKFQQAAHKAQVQATAFSSDFSKQVGSGTKDLFTLEKECARAANCHINNIALLTTSTSTLRLLLLSQVSESRRHFT